MRAHQPTASLWTLTKTGATFYCFAVLFNIRASVRRRGTKRTVFFLFIRRKRINNKLCLRVFSSAGECIRRGKCIRNKQKINERKKTNHKHVFWFFLFASFFVTRGLTPQHYYNTLANLLFRFHILHGLVTQMCVVYIVTATNSQHSDVVC